MGVGVGVLKEEYAYDLNAAAFTFNSKDLTDKKQFASQIYSVFFNFSTNVSKILTITLFRVSGETTYTLYNLIKRLPNDYNYVWPNELKLPSVVDFAITVNKTDSACLMNMMATYK